MNIKNLKEFLPYAFKTKVAVMIHGLHGIGKSQAVKQFAEENGLQFIDRRLSQMDSGDLIGLPDLSGDVTEFKTPAWLPRDKDSKGILFLDEINRARRDVLQGVFQLVLDRQLGDYVLPEGWHVVSAVNPNTDDYDVTNVFDGALMDRFNHIKLTPTEEEFIQYAQKLTNIDQSFVNFLQARPEMIEDSKLATFSLDRKPSRRSNIKAAELLASGLPEHLVTEGVGGLIGLTNVIAYTTWMKENNIKPFTAKEIFGAFSKIQERALKYSDASTGRHDVITASLDNAYNELESRCEKITEKQMKGLYDLLKVIPKDLAFSFAQRLISSKDTKLSKFAIDTFLESTETDWVEDYSKAAEAVPVETVPVEAKKEEV